jgi:hypothetical protein
MASCGHVTTGRKIKIILLLVEATTGILIKLDLLKVAVELCNGVTGIHQTTDVILHPKA